MFIKFVIKRELLLNTYSINNKIVLKKNLDSLVDFNLKNFRIISFSKPKMVGLSFFLSFFVLSNGSLVFVDFSFNKLNKGSLLFDDLYTL